MLLNVIAASRRRVSLDADALAYIAAVEFADGGVLEPAVKTAINDFIVTCKADGNWDPIKSCCLLAGPASLTGALVPLRGEAPTSYNFDAADYNRTTGLIGNASNKYLNANRNNNADPQNNFSMWVYTSVTGSVSVGVRLIGVAGSSTGSSNMLSVSSGWQARNRTSGFTTSVNGYPTGLVGISRSESGSFVLRKNGTTTTATANSETPANIPIGVFCGLNASEVASNFSSARIAAYGIGESVDLAKLDTALTAYMAAIAAAGL
jgi:hypothetical protein